MLFYPVTDANLDTPSYEQDTNAAKAAVAQAVSVLRAALHPA
ncbi:hypothetical protein [Nocardia africana]|uniref:Uncharacterized protein n=1 Tax=Nocardia africana TaxID=134964 RepID=A0ABW6NME6_9NOCA